MRTTAAGLKPTEASQPVVEVKARITDPLSMKDQYRNRRLEAHRKPCC